MIGNKRGFLRIIEAAVAVMLVAGVLLFFISKQVNLGDQTQNKILDNENIILNEISQSSDFRNIVLQQQEDVEISNNTIESGLSSIYNYARQRMPPQLNIKLKICSLNVVCGLNNYPQVNVYSQSIAITSNVTTYNPKQLKMFAWQES